MTKPPQLTRKSEPTGFGAALHQLRKAKGLTQDEAAELIGVHSVTYQRYEREEREISLRQAEDYAEAFGYSRDDLMDTLAALRGKQGPALRQGFSERDGPSYTVDLYGRARAGSRAPMAYQADQPLESVDLSWMFSGSAGFIRVSGDSGTGYVENGIVVAYDRNRWPSRGDGCVIETDEGEFYIKEYVQQNGDDITVKQRFPEMELQFKLSELKGIYKIRGRLD